MFKTKPNKERSVRISDMNQEMNHTFYYPFRIRIPVLSNSAIIVEHMEVLDEMHTICAHKHASYEIYYGLEGEPEIWIEGQTYTLRPKEFIIVPPNVWHQTMCTIHQQKKFFVFSFDLDFKKDSEKRNVSPQDYKFIAELEEVLSSESKCLAGVDAYDAMHALETLMQEFDSKQSGWTFLIRSGCMGFLIRLFRNVMVSQQGTDNLRSESNLSMEIMRYISRHFQENIKLEDIAAAVHVSPRHACRVFESCFGINMRHALHASRINIAKDLLQNTDYSIEKISEIIGYTDPDSFVRWFKKLEGSTITQFRNKCRQGHEKK